MMRRAETELIGHLILQILNVLRKEFDHLTALCTDHVVVMRMIVVMLVISLVVTESDLTGQARFGQKLKCPINGRVTDRGVLAMNQKIEILTRKMLFGLEKDLQDQVPLARSAQPGFLDVLQKYFLSLIHI